MWKLFVTLCLCLLVSSAQARVIEDVNIPERIIGEDGVTLTLNGAGVRSKFVFDVYIAQLYLENPSNSAEIILADDGQKRVVMHFLYSEVDQESLVDAWNEGFEDNLKKDQLRALQPKIDAFNAMFRTVNEGDIISLNYTAAKGTEVIITGESIGIVEGKDFNTAVLSIWLGKEPVTDDLKEEMTAF